MPFDTDTLKRHFDTHLEDLSCTVVIDGVTGHGSKGSNVRVRENLDAGYMEGNVFPVWFGTADGLTRPAPHSLVEVAGASYRVARVEEYADGSGWRMDLVDPEQANL